MIRNRRGKITDRRERADSNNNSNGRVPAQMLKRSEHVRPSRYAFYVGGRHTRPSPKRYRSLTLGFLEPREQSTVRARRTERSEDGIFDSQTRRNVLAPYAGEQ